MCGIVGYIGSRDAAPIILEGLKRLEYRGYDSAGLALFDGDQLKVTKTKGKVASFVFVFYRKYYPKKLCDWNSVSIFRLFCFS